jgi:hypothetical protein
VGLSHWTIQRVGEATEMCEKEEFGEEEEVRVQISASGWIRMC